VVEEGVRGVRMEGWMLFFTIVGAIGGTIAAGAAIYGVILTMRGIRTQAEQLHLQKDQAAMIPTLEVSNVRLVHAQDSEEVQATAWEMAKKKQDDQEAQAEAEWYEQKAAEWEKERQQKFSLGPSAINPYIKSDRRMMELHLATTDPARFERRHYNGPMPNAVLDLEIANNGKVAAENIFGILKLQAPYLRPIDFPDMDDRDISGPDEGFYRVQLARVSELLPDHKVEYRVGLQVTDPDGDNKVWIQYEFVTPAGVSLEGERTIELVPDPPRER
jgi:hypothetical protein